MGAKIHAREGSWALALSSLSALSSSPSASSRDTATNTQDLKADVEEGLKAEEQAKREMGAQLWTACYESATRALRVGAYAAAVREMRAECALRSGDVESAVGDLRCIFSFCFSTFAGILTGCT